MEPRNKNKGHLGDNTSIVKEQFEFSNPEMQVDSKGEEKFSFYKVNFNNFTYNDGDFIYCMNMREVFDILNVVESDLDTDHDTPVSVTIIPFVATPAEYAKKVTNYFTSTT